jgi:hypothetical protein
MVTPRVTEAQRGALYTLERVMGKWISIEKRLPKRGERVIVAHRRYEWSNARHKHYRLKTLGVRPATYWLKGHMGLQFCCSDGDVVKEPVAWMPFPEPPPG